MNKAILLSALLCAAPAAAQSWSTLSGEYSGIRTKAVREIRVETQEAWQALWDEHTAGVDPKPALPQVDFTQEMVVGVFLGQQGSSGKLKLELKPEGVPPVLTVKYSRGVGGEFDLTVMSQPFELRKVPKTYSSVKFVGPEAKGKPGAEAELRDAPAALPTAAMTKTALRMTGDARVLRTSGAAFDGSGVRTPTAGAPAVSGGRGFTAQLPPPPGGGGRDDDNGRRLPPPPGGGNDGGKPLPPPPGGGNNGGKPLPPPPGGGNNGGKPLPPPPGATLPRPIYPGGPLPSDHPRLKNASPVFTTFGLDYIGYWNDGVYWKAAKGRVETAPADAATTVYSMRLESGKYQGKLEFYHDAQNDTIHYVKTEKLLDSEARRVEVVFEDRATKPLMPWERETFVFALDRTNVSLDSENGAYSYDVTTTVPAGQRDTVRVTMTPRAKIKTAPDAAGVTAGLRSAGGKVKLVVNDKWAKEYAGENIEIAYVVKWDDGSFFRRDPVVGTAKTSAPFSQAAAASIEIDIPAVKAGEYYLESWSFRRAGSAISSAQWVNKGKGNTVKR